MRLGLFLLAGLGAALLIRAQLDPANQSGDASNRYTDHLRHEGESRILALQGFACAYRCAYATHNVLDGIHAGLFPERTAPYPPLAILVHLPWSYVHWHRALVWMWALVAFAAAFVVVRLVEPLTLFAEGWALLLAVPLLVGIGINGFIDGGYLLCGALGCLAWRDERPASALIWLALASALHFRAAVFAPLALAIVWQLRHRPVVSLAAAAMVLPTLLAAWALGDSLGLIPADSPVHASHPNVWFALFLAVGAAAALFLVRTGEPLVALTVLAAVAVGVAERSHGWWHAGALLAPGLVLAARRRTFGWHWPVVVAWTGASGYLAYRHAASVFWTWLPFAT